jgi:hypothetical protein
MVGVTAGDEKPSEGFSHADRAWFGPVAVEVA